MGYGICCCDLDLVGWCRRGVAKIVSETVNYGFWGSRSPE